MRNILYTTVHYMYGNTNSKRMDEIYLLSDFLYKQIYIYLVCHKNKYLFTSPNQKSNKCCVSFFFS